MRRLQIFIDADLDDVLASKAGREKTSKAAIIHRVVQERLRQTGMAEDDPVGNLIGAYDTEPGEVDAVIYGP